MPFGRDLAPGMLHRHNAHSEAVARIGWCVTEHRIGVITGEVGAGKTVAIRAALSIPDDWCWGLEDELAWGGHSGGLGARSNPTCAGTRCSNRSPAEGLPARELRVLRGVAACSPRPSLSSGCGGVFGQQCVDRRVTDGRRMLGWVHRL